MASLFENIEDYASTSDRIKEQLNKKACEAIEAEKLKVCEGMFKEEDEEIVDDESEEVEEIDDDESEEEIDDESEEDEDEEKEDNLIEE